MLEDDKVFTFKKKIYVIMDIPPDSIGSFHSTNFNNLKGAMKFFGAFFKNICVKKSIDIDNFLEVCEEELDIDYKEIFEKIKLLESVEDIVTCLFENPDAYSYVMQLTDILYKLTDGESYIALYDQDIDVTINKKEMVECLNMK